MVLRCSATLFLSAILAACSAGEPPPAAETRYNVVFVLADTLRADHLGSWGYERTTSPFLDRFAEDNLQFLGVRSQAGCTFPSVNSLWTSRFPVEFFDGEGAPSPRVDIPTIAQILERRGYDTAAVSASPVVRSTPSEHNPIGGYGHGFDVFDETCLWAPSECVTTRGRQLLSDGLEEPFLLYLHYMDPHDPYIALAEHRGRFAKEYEGGHSFIAEGDPNPIEPLIREGRAEEELSDDDFGHLEDLYDEAILSFDTGLRSLYADLESRQLLDRTILVVASDHGENFFEHGYVKHCYTVYGTETHVPLLMHLPSVAEAGVFDDAVQNLDIVPTLVDYLGIAVDDLYFEGRSLRPLIEGRPFENLAYSMMGVYRAIDDGRHRVILDLSGNRGVFGWALYDLQTDPGETENLLSTRPAEVIRTFRRLREELESRMEAEGRAGIDEQLERAREFEERLRSLGYLAADDTGVESKGSSDLGPS